MVRKTLTIIIYIATFIISYKQNLICVACAPEVQEEYNEYIKLCTYSINNDQYCLCKPYIYNKKNKRE